MKNRKVMTLILVAVAVLVGASVISFATNAFRRPAGRTESRAPAADYGVYDGTVVIKLPENITTGYSWHYTIDKDGVVSLIRDEYIEPGQEGVVGAAGVHTWEFGAAGPGTAVVKFDYYRSWEGIEQSAETHSYSITVDEAGKISISEIK